MRRVAWIPFLAVMLFGFGLLFGVKLSRWFGWGRPARAYNTVTVVQQVQTLSELVTVKYVMEKVEILEIPSQNLVGQIVGSQNRVMILAHGIVKAGVDLKRIKPEDVQVQSKCLILKLPLPQITDAYLDDRRTQVIDRATGLLAPSDRDLEQTARQNAVDDIRRAARESGILQDAEDRARLQIRSLCLQLGFDQVIIKTPAAAPHEVFEERVK